MYKRQGLYYVLAKNDPYVLDAIRAAEAYDLAALDIDQPERDRVDIDQGSPGNPEPRVLPGTDQ